MTAWPDGSGILSGRLPVYGRGGVPLLRAWAQGPRALHGFYTHGFPNLFQLGPLQNAASVNFTHVLDEQARHVAEVVAEARGRRARYVEPTSEAQDRWLASLRENALDLHAFQAECTSGYYNNEGMARPRNETYADGPVAFSNLLRRWRAGGGMDAVLVGRRRHDGAASQPLRRDRRPDRHQHPVAGRAAQPAEPAVGFQRRRLRPGRAPVRRPVPRRADQRRRHRHRRGGGGRAGRRPGAVARRPRLRRGRIDVHRRPGAGQGVAARPRGRVHAGLGRGEGAQRHHLRRRPALRQRAAPRRAHPRRRPPRPRRSLRRDGRPRRHGVRRRPLPVGGPDALRRGRRRLPHPAAALRARGGRRGRSRASHLAVRRGPHPRPRPRDHPQAGGRARPSGRHHRGAGRRARRRRGGRRPGRGHRRRRRPHRARRGTRPSRGRGVRRSGALPCERRPARGGAPDRGGRDGEGRRGRARRAAGTGRPRRRAVHGGGRAPAAAERLADHGRDQGGRRGPAGRVSPGTAPGTEPALFTHGMPGLPRPFAGLAVAPDGSLLLSANGEGSVWRLEA